MCCNWFPGKEIEVDHIVPAGRLRSFEDIGGFVERLFCERENLMVLCEQCHRDKHDSSMEK